MPQGAGKGGKQMAWVIHLLHKGTRVLEDALVGRRANNHSIRKQPQRLKMMMPLRSCQRAPVA